MKPFFNWSIIYKVKNQKEKGIEAATLSFKSLNKKVLLSKSNSKSGLICNGFVISVKKIVKYYQKLWVHSYLCICVLNCTGKVIIRNIEHKQDNMTAKWESPSTAKYFDFASLIGCTQRHVEKQYAESFKTKKTMCNISKFNQNLGGSDPVKKNSWSAL